MLNKKQPEIAVRLFDNNKYGTTYAKGLYRKAIYNGTIEIAGQGKYLVDLYSYDEWMHMAKTDDQMLVLDSVKPQSDGLYSWIKRYDSDTKEKTLVPGICRLDCESMDLTVAIVDEAHDLADTWELKAKPCKLGSKSPQLLATNTDLSSW